MADGSIVSRLRLRTSLPFNVLDDRADRGVPPFGDLRPFVLQRISQGNKIVRAEDVLELVQARDQLVHPLDDGLIADLNRLQVQLQELGGLSHGLLGLQPAVDRLFDQPHRLGGVVLLQVLGGFLLHLLRGAELGAELALIVALAMLAVVVMGAMIGMLLPFILQRFNMDPATASTPLITSVADVGGILIYFSIASAVLSLPSSAG